jgi:MOSC domain-containing protein YiiM
MTILTDDIDIHSPANETKLAIRNNVPLDSVLHVVAVVSNPCRYKRRIQLAREFVHRMKHEGSSCVSARVLQV